MKKPTIKQQILDRLSDNVTMSYGDANKVTVSQSGYRRMQELLSENPKKYRFVKVKSRNGGYYNVFGTPKAFKVFGGSGRWFLIASGYIPKTIGEFNTKQEALSKIKKVVR
jgi:hypothetical protein